MSDYESIMMDAVFDALADEQYTEHLADLQEEAESALMELFRNQDIDARLTKLKDQDTYGDPLHAVLQGLVDSVQHKIDQEKKNRRKGGLNSVKSRRETRDEKLAERQEVADPLFKSGQYVFKIDVAREVIKREIAYRRSYKDFLGRQKAPECISDKEEEDILKSEVGYLARQLIDPTK